MGALIGFTLLRLVQSLSLSSWLVHVFLHSWATLVILLSFLRLLLFLVGQINILRYFINYLSQLASLSHPRLLFLIIWFVGSLLLPCSQLLWAEVWIDRIVKLPIYRRIFHRLFCLKVGVLEQVFTFHQSRYRLILLVRYQMRILAHHRSFLCGLVVSEHRLAWCQALGCYVMLHASADCCGFWFCISNAMHRPHVILTKLRFHVEAVLQVLEVLPMSFGLVVQLTALGILVFVSCQPWLWSMLSLVTVDALIFDSDARSGCQCLLGECLIASVLLLEVRDVFEILTLSVITRHSMTSILLARASQELIWLLRLHSSDQLTQELLLVIYLGIVYDLLHEVLLIFGAAQI